MRQGRWVGRVRGGAADRAEDEEGRRKVQRMRRGSMKRPRTRRVALRHAGEDGLGKLHRLAPSCYAGGAEGITT